MEEKKEAKKALGEKLLEAAKAGVDLEPYVEAVKMFSFPLEKEKRETNLGYANLEGANLGYANFEGANFEGANLEGANLRYANLTHVRGWDKIISFKGANIYGARGLSEEQRQTAIKGGAVEL